MVREACAAAETPSPACCVPTTTPGPNPVTAVPGLVPRSPVTVVRPVLVTVGPAGTLPGAAHSAGAAAPATAPGAAPPAAMRARACMAARPARAVPRGSVGKLDHLPPASGQDQQQHNQAAFARVHITCSRH